MEDLIQPNAVLTLAILHGLIIVLLFGLAALLLPKSKRFAVAIIFVLLWTMSLVAMLDFMAGNTGFISWFMNPAAERNLPTMLSSSFLLANSAAALLILWQSRKERAAWEGGYWILLGFLFIFLSLDEYFSIHESILFWRNAYLGLGGTVGLLSLLMIFRSRSKLQRPLLLFVIGFGTIGFSGVILNAFTTQSIISFGSIELDFLTCRHEFMGVLCRDFNNSQDTGELFGEVLVLMSLLTVAQIYINPQQWKRRQTSIVAVGLTWFVLLAASLWILPAIQSLSAKSVVANYGDLSLIAYSVSESTIEADDTLEVSIYMRVNQSITSDYSLSVHLYTQALPDVDSIAQDDMELGDFKYPTRAWLPYLPVRNDFRLQIPDDLATSASYRLVAILWQDTPENTIAVKETSLDTLANGTVTILDGIAAPPSDIDSIPMSAAYDFAPNFSLEGYELPEEVAVGNTITVDFWWSSKESVDVELTHFLHWFHSETGEYVIFDQIPFAGAFPTQDWPKNLLAQDSWTITLPDDMPAGIYRVQTGLFGVASGERIPVTDADGERVLDDSIVLGVVTVKE